MLDPAVLTFALVAGAVAAFNPCGFALLPAYLSMLMVPSPADPTGAASRVMGRGVALARAVRFSTGMTVGFVAVFGLFGAVISPLALSVERYLPILTVVIGGFLLLLGGWLVSGRTLSGPGLPRWGTAPTRSWVSQIGYGVAFALASLSCTVGPFLAVTSGSLRGGGVFGVLAAFLAYAAGMGIVVLVLAVAVVTASTSVVARMRRAARLISRLSGVLLLVAGSYVAWYGWFELRVLAGTTTSDPVVGAAVRVQGTLTRAVVPLGAPVLAALAVVLVAGAILALRRRKGPTTEQSRSEPTENHADL